MSLHLTRLQKIKYTRNSKYYNFFFLETQNAESFYKTLKPVFSQEYSINLSNYQKT